jgi:RHS repeat-associated protein
MSNYDPSASYSTPAVSFTYDAMGRQKVAQTFVSASGEIVSSTTNIYSGLDLVAEIQNGVRIDKQVDAFGRPKGIAIGTDYAVDYGFDEYGRFNSVQSAQSVATNLFTYSYLPGSHLLKGYTATQPVSSFEFQVSKNYEPNRDLITTISNTFGTATISAFGYENDAFGRRTARTDTTPTLTVNNAFGYNLKSEVTSATMGENAYNYDYDPIGNRVQSAVAVGSGQSETNTYSANALNQYSSLQPINLSYDFDGNMLTNGIWSYSWDAENRLTSVYSNNTLLVSNVYDHQSRRIAKNLFEITQSGTNAIRQFSFVYDGWNLISETLSTSNFSLSTFYTWGLDLSGTLQGAGGVGGLLAVTRGSTVYFPCFDANGNVTEYIDATGTIRAHYAFDAFGNTIAQSGDLAPIFSHRFSTKYFDPETALYYYGYRFYLPELGRWVNRDPIEERGGINQYSAMFNNAISLFDPFGLKITGKDKIVALKKDYQKNEKVEFKSDKKVCRWEVTGKIKIRKSGNFSVYVVPTAPSEEENDSEVTAVYKDGTKEAMSTTVIRPNYLTRFHLTDKSQPTYQPKFVMLLTIYDQFEKPFPEGVPVSEKVDLNAVNFINTGPLLGDTKTNSKGQLRDTFGAQLDDNKKDGSLGIYQIARVGDWEAVVVSQFVYKVSPSSIDDPFPFPVIYFIGQMKVNFN